MGKAKQAANDTKKFTLQEEDWKFLKVLNFALQMHVMKDQIITGFLILLCTQKFGYGKNLNLQFEIDLGDESMEMIVHEVSDEEVAAHVEKERIEP